MDSRVQRTRTRLIQCLRELMLKHPWDTVSVALLCQEAEISRSTFYSHFATKQDLLELSISQLAKELHPEGLTRGLDGYGNLRFLAAFLDHVKSYQQIYLQNQFSASLSVILNNMRKMTNGLIEYEVANSRYRQVLSTDQLAFFSGGVWTLIEIWVNQRCTEPERVVLNRLDQLVLEYLGTRHKRQ